jgi:hypothetical protein
MKYYIRIFVPDFETIQTKTDQFLNKIEWRPKVGFHALPWSEYTEYCPEILTAFEKLYGLKPVWAATYITYNDTHSKIHVDNRKPCRHDHECRISLPIRNCEGTYTEFFTGGEYDEFRQPSGEKFYVLKDNSTATKVDQVEMTGPTVMRVMEPHRVCHPHNMQRVNLTVYTDKDPVFLLD